MNPGRGSPPESGSDSDAQAIAAQSNTAAFGPLSRGIGTLDGYASDVLDGSRRVGVARCSAAATQETKDVDDEARAVRDPL